MADLRYDTEVLRNTAKKYREISAEMEKNKKELRQTISDLKSTYWKSFAGDQFQDLYEDGWAKNVEKYIDVLDEMAEQLDKAAIEYDKVTDQLRKIEGVST